MLTRRQANVSVFSYQNFFWWTLAITFVIKLLLSTLIPITGDEAYYATWGEHIAPGYYDHTPLIGWLLYPFLRLGHNIILLRLPTVLMTSILGLVIYEFLKPNDPERAALAAMIFLVSPLSLCAVLVTTDTPVILFSFLSGVCVLKALQKNDHLGWFALAGLSLGLAFFSKYFAVLLAITYFIYFIFIAPSRRRLLGLLIIFLGVLPFGLENLYWNYTHGWANILFNVYNRNASNHFGLGTVLIYLITLFYIITPPLFYYLCKYKLPLNKKQDREIQAMHYFIALPLLFFLLLSTHKEIGLHWPLAFITFIYLWAGLSLTSIQLQKSLIFMFWFTGAHLLLIFTLALTPMKIWQKLPISDALYTKMVYFFEHKTIRTYLDQYNEDYIIMSLNYSESNIMAFDSGIYTPTFGIGSVHGRQDDLLTNFQKLSHHNILIFYIRPPRPSEYLPYFAHAEVQEFQVDGANFYYVLGQDFNYPVYRDTVLLFINNKYWKIPGYLPYKTNFFHEKYFGVLQTGAGDGNRTHAISLGS